MVLAALLDLVLGQCLACQVDGNSYCVGWRTAVSTRQSSAVRYRIALVSSFMLEVFVSDHGSSYPVESAFVARVCLVFCGVVKSELKCSAKHRKKFLIQYERAT